ncbi:MAG TPA: DUF58 domain-containing protein [Acidobacteriota bacterium]|nr:DUF58 domain-containing protein [Acidobacteriota bacterium]
MPRYFEILKSRFNTHSHTWNAKAIRDFLVALILLGTALLFALAADNAARRGENTVCVVLSVLALVLALVTAVTIVPRIARRVHFSKWLLPFSFSITREGGVYLLIVFLLSLAAINTGNNLLFLILAAMLSAILISGIVARTSLRSVFVSLQVPENVFEGERISVKVSLKNTKRFFPSFSISVEDVHAVRPHRPLRLRSWFRRGKNREAHRDSGAGSVLSHPAYFPVIPAGETRTELVYQSFPRRGPFRLEGFKLSTRFPFGFFRRGERVRAGGEVLVYPSIQEVSSYYHLLPFLPGRLEGKHLGHGESLYAIRRYQEGESARLVDWKATAKTHELMARDYAREEESKFCLILDTLIHPTARADYADRFEEAVSLAASLAAHFSEEGAELELLTPLEYVPRGIGIAHLYLILRSLAVVTCSPPTAETSTDLRDELSGVVEEHILQEILSDKVFKIIITSKPKGSFSYTLWHSSHVIYFDEL